MIELSTLLTMWCLLLSSRKINAALFRRNGLGFIVSHRADFSSLGGTSICSVTSDSSDSSGSSHGGRSRHGGGRKSRRGRRSNNGGGDGAGEIQRRPRLRRVEASPSTVGVASAWDPPALTMPPDGVVAVYKPQGWSSADVVGRVRWVLQSTLRDRLGEKRKVKVGHGGTLDPLATGVLVLGIGKGCRDLEAYLKGTKRYRTLARLGSETTTLDSEGGPVEGGLGAANWSHVGLETHLNRVLSHFTGDVR